MPQLNECDVGGVKTVLELTSYGSGRPVGCGLGGAQLCCPLIAAMLPRSRFGPLAAM